MYTATATMTAMVSPCSMAQPDQIALGRKRPVMHRADGRVAYGRILPVEPRGVCLDPRVIQGCLERQICRRGNLSRPVGYYQRESQRSHLFSQAEQRLGFGSGPGIVQPAKYAGVEPAGGCGVGLKVPEDQDASAQTQRGEQCYQRSHHGGGQSLQPVATHRESNDRRPCRVPALPVP